MTKFDRRQFLGLAGASSLPLSIRKALAIPAAMRTGTIQDVEHVVILTQENRSFSHYFGTLPGVRGFGDRITVPQSDGRSVWQQRYEADGAHHHAFYMRHPDLDQSALPLDPLCELCSSRTGSGDHALQVCHPV